MSSSLDAQKLRLKRLKRVLTHMFLGYIKWRSNNYRPPSPYSIKKKTLQNNAFPNVGWIETGTYLGETTKFLSKNYSSVITIEPSAPHFNYVSKRFRKISNVKVINTTSENSFSELLRNSKDELNIYLDGHYSGDGTFGESKVTPVKEELDSIEKSLDRFKKLFVAIDDFRVFTNSDSAYPSRYYLIDFCKRNNLIWNVEQDIFMFWKK
jgi:hypothetical protein